MSHASVSVMEIRFLDETFELVEEEFDGIMEDAASGYVLTTGAAEQVEEARALLRAFLERLEPENESD